MGPSVRRPRPTLDRLVHHLVVGVVAAALLAGCGASGPSIQTGANAERSPDGLHKVDGVGVGTLFMQPDYAFGTYDEFILGKTLITFEKGAKVLSAEDTENLTSIFETVATRAIEETGRTKAAARAACVAVVNLALVDTEITGGTAGGGGTAGIGAVTLVLEIRDGRTNEPLLRYGQRRRLSGASLSAAFKRFVTRFGKDFQRSIPRATPESIMTCEERSGGTAPIDSP